MVHASTAEGVAGQVVKEMGSLNTSMKRMKLNKDVVSPSLGGDVWSPSGNSGLKIGKQLKEK